MKRALVLIVALALGGCGAALAEIDDSVDPATAEKLSKCRTEARAFVQTSADPQSAQTAREAFAVYEQCKAREGVK